MSNYKQNQLKDAEYALAAVREQCEKHPNEVNQKDMLSMCDSIAYLLSSLSAERAKTAKMREALELIAADNDCMVGAGIIEEMVGEDECTHCIAEKALADADEKKGE